MEKYIKRIDEVIMESTGKALEKKLFVYQREPRITGKITGNYQESMWKV